MENVNRWYFTKDQLANTPSKKCNIDYAKELSYRQQAANFIQDMGQRLQLSQLCINTAIVYMHRFYVFHSFSEVHRNNLSISALFLAAKVEEQPRKLEHVIKVAHVCLHKDKDAPPLDVRSEAYAEKAQEVVAHENILLQTLGFVLAIEHPHTYVVKVCQLVKASKDLAQSSYLMATTSLHMTTMCIQYKPTVVACVCIHLACKWSSYLIEPCSEGREWFYYVDRTVTLELLEKLTQEFIAILETSPHRFKRKFGKESAGYHNPKSIIENAAKEAKEASASSEKRNGLSGKKEPSPGPSTSLSYDFCPDFDEKPAIRFDNGPDHSRKPPAMQQISVKKPPVMSINKKVHEPQEVPKKQEPVQKAPAVHVKAEPAEVEAKVEPLEVDPKTPWLPLASLSSEKRNGLSPIVDPPAPSPMDSFDFNYVPTVETAKPVAIVRALDHGVSTGHVSSKKSSDSHSSSKHERREKHKSKHSSRSSKDKHNTSNHAPEQPLTGITVKISKDKISLKGREFIQKTVAKEVTPPPPKPESPMRSLKIKLPKPPATPPEPPKVAKPPTPASLKLVITKDKSGSGSYSMKNERDSRKRSHSSSNSVAPDMLNYKNSHEPPPPSKCQKVNHSSSKSHYKADGYPPMPRPNKVSRHGSHNSSNNPGDVYYQKPNDKTTFQHGTYNYPPMVPPPYPPNYPVMHMNSRLNSSAMLQPPLPPPLAEAPPPPPPPE